MIAKHPHSIPFRRAAKAPVRQSLAIALTLLLGLAACTNTVPADSATSSSTLPALSLDTLPPIDRLLSCLPPEAALVAAHRGNGAFLGAPENSLSGLEALIERGVLMAEIDVARIGDGTLISFHDGVWEMKSSGQGPVVATPASDFMTIRLRARENGPIGGESVPTFVQMLDAAQDRIYLEVDFKTSADIDRAIAEIRARDMQDQVVLIATRDDEAALLRPYADEFILSLPDSAAMDGQGVWVGSDWRNGALTGLPNDAVVIGAQWQADGASGAGPLDILVTDEITRFDPIVGLSDPAAFKACLNG